MATPTLTTRTLKIHFVVRIQSRQPTKPALSIFPIVLPDLSSVRSNTENPALEYDYGTEMYAPSGERVVMGVSIPNVQGDQISLCFEEFPRVQVQQMMMNHVFDEVKGSAFGKRVDLQWRLATGIAREHGMVKEGEGADFIYYWYDLVSWTVDFYLLACVCDIVIPRASDRKLFMISFECLVTNMKICYPFFRPWHMIFTLVICL
jgi:hypothetical protein